MIANKKNEIPCVGQTPMVDQFCFELAPQILEENEQLQQELHHLREYISEQKQQTDTRERVVKELTNVVEDIVALYPRFVDNDINCENMALVKGYEYANDIVSYIDKFKESARILQFIKTELQNIRIENASYRKCGCVTPCRCTTMYIACETASSIIGFNSTDKNIHHPFAYLHNTMNSIITETLKFGHWKRDGTRGNFVFYYGQHPLRDGIHYKSNEEHAQIWEWKKAFATRMVSALLTYVEYLLEN